jgi:ribosomal protein S17E
MREERKTKLQLDDPQNKTTKLRRRREALRKKSAANKVENDDDFLAFARNECLEFCTKVHKALPREIRNTIYGYITNCKDVYATSQCQANSSGNAPFDEYLKVNHFSAPSVS